MRIGPIKVMVVDDERDFTEMLARSLTEVGEKVYSAFSGQECLDLLNKEPSLDVVILDIKMPGLDGMETLRRIKTEHPLVEVIMLTGHGTIESAVAGMKIGAFDYLLKPADFKELVEKLGRAAKRKEEHEARIQRAEAEALLEESRRRGKSPLSV